MQLYKNHRFLTILFLGLTHYTSQATTIKHEYLPLLDFVEMIRVFESSIKPPNINNKKLIELINNEITKHTEFMEIFYEGVANLVNGKITIDTLLYCFLKVHFTY